MLAEDTVFANSNENAASSLWSSAPSTAQSIQEFEHYDTVFFDGDDADSFFEVLDGIVASYRILADGRRQILGFHFAGDVVGFSHDGEYHAHCCAIGNARVRRIARASMMRTVAERPEIASKLLECATSQLVGMQNHFVLLGRKNAQEKIASFLLALARRQADEDAQTVVFRLPMARMEIADYLGLTVETVSRTLTKLRVAGVIHLPHSSIVEIRSMRKLEVLAGSDDEYN